MTGGKPSTGSRRNRSPKPAGARAGGLSRPSPSLFENTELMLDLIADMGSVRSGRCDRLQRALAGLLERQPAFRLPRRVRGDWRPDLRQPAAHGDTSIRRTEAGSRPHCARRLCGRRISGRGAVRRPSIGVAKAVSSARTAGSSGYVRFPQPRLDHRQRDRKGHSLRTAPSSLRTAPAPFSRLPRARRNGSASASRTTRCSS